MATAEHSGKPFCRAHYMVVRGVVPAEAADFVETVDRMASRRRGSVLDEVLGGVSALVDNFLERRAVVAPPGDHFVTRDQFRAMLGDLVRKSKAQQAASARAQREAAERLRRATVRNQTEVWARGVLGFDPDEALTVDAVKTRQRALARKHHPDLGGNESQMQKINRAAAALVEALSV